MLFVLPVRQKNTTTMKTILLVLTGLAGLLSGPDITGYQTESPDSKFVREAAEGGMLEVKLGELATQKGMSAKVKEFGKTMVTDHTKVNDELKSLAGKKQIKVPTVLSNAKQQKYDSLAATSGEKFDMLYMNMMIASHEQTIGLFQTESNKGQDPDLKKWADAKVPALKHHLMMAQQLFQASPNGTGRK
jgi:putative membrane protein